ncbi:MAG: AAA family ATPase [Rickettsiales bacterium]|nr:AAA family ATPase [Rickettsiales bacterium]
MSDQFISEIVLNNFRNYANAKFNFYSDFNIIAGPNGIGKTNLLEAISLFSNSKGIRKATTQELINLRNKTNNKNNNNNIQLPNDILFSLFLKYTKNKDESKLLILQKEDKKLLKHNDDILKKGSLLTNILKITWLTPQMDSFFTGASADRRKFIDRTAELLFSDHYDNVKRYEFFVKERMKILTTQTMNDRWLDIVEKKIVQLGVSIASVRNDTVNYLNNIFENNTKNFPTGYILINGIIENMLVNSKAIEVEDLYLKTMFNNRSEDAISKRTNFGIHKSDIIIMNKFKNMLASLCSTGEQKMLLISLIFVRAIFTKQLNNGIPILLLDEICSHIDNNTRELFFEELRNLNIQTFLTGTKKEDFLSLSNNFINI